MAKGYTKSGRKLPEILCCQCSGFVRHGHWNQLGGRSYDEACEKCARIVARKATASNIKHARAKKKELREMGKRMIAYKEKYQNITRDDGTKMYEDAWTPMRYVGKKELDKIRSRYKAGLVEKELIWWERCFGFGVPVYKRTGVYPTIDDWITRPGYYRVDPTKNDKCWRFSRVCASGLPIYYQNRRFEKTEQERSDDNRKHWAGVGAFRAIKNELIVAQKRTEYRKKTIMQKPTPKDAKQFFQTLAMGAAVSEKLGTTE